MAPYAVNALDEDLRLPGFYGVRRVSCVVDVVHTAESHEHICPLAPSHDRPAWAFVDSMICGESDHEDVSELAGSLEVRHMTWVEEIEAAIRHYDDHERGFSTMRELWGTLAARR